MHYGQDKIRFNFKIKTHWNKNLRMLDIFFFVNIFFPFLFVCILEDFTKRVTHDFIEEFYTQYYLVNTQIQLGWWIPVFYSPMYIVRIGICSTFSSNFINNKSQKNIFKEYYFTRKYDKNCIKLLVKNWIILQFCLHCSIYLIWKVSK